MKLFEVYYMENNDDVSYLTVGNDDTEDSIEEKEMIVNYCSMKLC